MDRANNRDPLCWDWNPGRSPGIDETVVPPRNDATRTRLVPPSPGSRPAPPTESQPSSLADLAEPLAAFTIHPHNDPLSIDPDVTIGVFSEAEPRFSGGSAALASSSDGEASPFPVVGDGIGGYRLLAELGRGAFGRVFLAEESLLGNRLVALKITRAEGDEPRLLARLQHTHIVPIHSVHDDPRTGLRMMCMPYVGGANLAQVLEAVTPLGTTQRDQRSLLNALDIVGLPPPSEALSPTGVLKRRSSFIDQDEDGFFGSPQPAQLGDLVPSSAAQARTQVKGNSASLPGAGSGGQSRSRPVGATSASRWPLLSHLPRWSKSLAVAQRAWPLGKVVAENERGPIQPARRFLRGANFIRAAAWVIARLAEGLEHAHSHGLLHRDLKPSNILIAADGTPMLLDFNLAADGTVKAADEDKVRMGGTLPYMSPEHLDAFHPNGTTPAEQVDERSDIYALGLILYEMIAGNRPFTEPDPSRSLLDMIRIMIDERRAGAPSLRSVCPNVPRDLDAVVRKSLHPDPAKRHAHAGDLAEDLRRFLDDQPLLYTPEPTLRGRVVKWVRRNPRATGASTVGLVGLTLIIGLSTAAWSVSHHLSQVSARLRFQNFEARFPECQFLLNTVGGPGESLGRGITLAQETLEQAGVTLNPQHRTGGGEWVALLAVEEQREVRRDLAELILLVARARVYLADRSHATTDRQTLEQAIAWLDRAEAIDPSPTVTLYDDRANYLTRIGQVERASADRSRRDAIAPTTGRDFYLLGTALLSRGEADRAEAVLIKATGLSPQGFWPWFALGLCHYDQKRFTESAGDFAVCSVLNPRFAWPWMNRGLALAQVGRLIEARAAYDRAVEADASLRDAFANRGLVALELGDSPAAITDLKRAVALGRSDVNIQAALGEALGRAGQTTEAIQLLDRLVSKHPEAILPRVARGTLRLTTDPAGAEDDFCQILKASPRDSGALLGMARLKRLMSPVEALQYATLALEADPNRIDTVELAAWLRGKLGDPAVIGEVDRLASRPTANRLYNAACSLALYIAVHPDRKLGDRAIGYLRRAIKSGIPATMLRSDPDLASLRSDPAFRELLPRPTDLSELTDR